MIEKTVKKHKLKESSTKNDYKYWLSKSPEERVSAVEIIRRQYKSLSDEKR